jgi:hypothetical protein
MENFSCLGSGNDEVTSLLKELKGIGTKEFEEVIFTDFDDYFQWCLSIAAVLLLIEWLLSERKTRFSFKI